MMDLKIIGSSSLGNSYLLENDNEALMIECGVNFQRVKETLNFNTSKVVGCIMTHEHMDHAKAYKKVMESGIDLYATKGTFEALSIEGHRAKVIPQKGVFMVGNFKVMSFDVMHDVEEPCGFIISHPDCGKVLFLTDTLYSPYTFTGLNNIIIEANYCKQTLDRGKINTFLRNRILKSHMSLDTCKKFLRANDLSQVNNIVLIHLSDRNSDEKRFKKEVEELTGKTVTVASPKVEIDFNKTPF